MTRRWRLFPKYALLIIALVAGMLLASGAVGIYFSHRENQDHLAALQNEKAQGAANRIEQYVRGIEHELGWTALPRIDGGAGSDALEARRIEYLKLLRQAPAITEVVWIDADGREQLRVSRLAMDALGSGRDVSLEPKYTLARAGKTWFGPVYFRKGTEPYMTISRPAGGGGVTAAEVNLKFVWEVVSRIRIGEKGLAYVVDASGTLIAHPDISLVLKKTDLSALPQVAALARPDEAPSGAARDLRGEPVLAAFQRIPTLAWTVFVESPRAEVFAPLYATLQRMALVLVLALLLSMAASFFLARALVRPLRALQEGALQIGAGDLDRRIEVRTGDELEGLAEQFNQMGAALKASYAGLERKVEQRTAELSESLDYQTAISEVLRVISKSPTDVAPVFEAILDSASRLFGNPLAAVCRYDGLLVHLVATHNWPAAAIEDARRLYPAPPNPQMMSGRVLLSGQVQSEEDALNDPAYDRQAADFGHWRRMLGAPLLKDGTPIGAIIVAWPEPGVTPQRQADLLKTFADQAVIAIENVRLLNETKEALEQQTATAEILQVISSSVSNTQPVFDTILASCEHLFDGQHMGINLVGADGLVHLAAHRGPTPDREAFERTFPVPLTRESGSGSAILDRRVMHYPDVEADGVPLYVQRSSRAVMTRSVILAPLLWEGRGIGAIFVGRGSAGPFSEKDIALLRTFADQAVIAIQNARLFNETKDALEQQTATSEVLKTISRTTFDLEPVLATLIESASRLCRADKGFVYLRDGDAYQIKVSYRVEPGSIDTRPLAAEPGTLVGRTALTREIVHIEDARNDPSYTWKEAQGRLGYRTMLGVPMLREGEPIGVVAMWRDDVKPFSQRDIRVVTTFADQAVIAIENVRLFSETREALEQQTATAEILRVISGSPTDVQPVFDAIAERAMTLCEARVGGVTRFDGELVHLVAYHGVSAPAADAMRAAFPMKPGRGAITARAILERRPVQIADVLADPEYGQKDAARDAGFRSNLGVPMLRDGQVVGSIAVCRAEPGLFPDKLVRLLQTFADQAVIAIENVRLFNETKEALEQQTATSEILQVISHSVSDVQPVFDKIMDSCQRLFDGSEMGILLRGDDGLLHLGAHHGSALETLKGMYPRPLDGSVPGLAMVDQRLLNYPDVLAAPDAPTVLREIAGKMGNYSIIVAPMIWKEQAIGTIHVTRSPPVAFSNKELNLLQTFADQAVIAIQNARLFHEIEDKSRQLELANKHKSEFLANMSHELRTPLNAIIGFSEVLSEQMFGEVNEKQLEYLQDIHSSGHHLLSLINDILDLSKIEAGRMELDLASFNLPMLLDNTTTLVRERAMRQGLTLLLDVDPTLGDWVADQRKLKQVVINLLSNAVKFTPAGGRVTLRARALEHAIEIAVVDTGVGIAPDQQALVFEEFRQAGGDYLRKAEGTGLGLPLAKRFVELHGGSMGVESAPGQGSTFAFILPEKSLEAAQ